MLLYTELCACTLVRCGARCASKCVNAVIRFNGLKMREFKVGDQVRWYYPWTGPFEVTDVAKDRNVACIGGYGRHSWVHASSLKPVVKNAGWQIIVNPI